MLFSFIVQCFKGVKMKSKFFFSKYDVKGTKEYETNGSSEVQANYIDRQTDKWSHKDTH